MAILAACTSVNDRFAWCLQKPQEGVRASGIAVTDYCQRPPCGYRKLNLEPLKEQRVSSLNR